MANKAAYGSDVIVDLLTELDIDYIAFNPGATFRGLHDSLVNYRTDIPLIECTHEEISVAIAHGYAKATGRMMAAALHDVVGLQHATMAIYNAWCDRVPVLLLGGMGPVDAARRRPWIDWIHAANLQANQVRDYTKWDDQPASLQAVPESLIRARQIATTAPRGPVYVCLDSDVQENLVPEGFEYTSPKQYSSPAPLAPDAATVSTILDWLRAAEFPAIVIESIDGLAQASKDLQYIATELGIAVVEPARDYGRPALCLPTAHPLNVTGAWEDLPPADMVLMIEVPDLEAVRIPVANDARIAQVGTKVLGARAWAADLQRLQRADVVALASPAPLLAALRHALESQPASNETAALRVERISNHTLRARQAWDQFAREAPESGGIDQSLLAVSVWDAVQDHDPVLANGSLSDWAHRTWDLRTPDSYLGSSGGAGLGYGLGASIGAALAHRTNDRLVVNLQSDGDLLMTPSALWTLAHEELPLLIVLDNNRAYQNSVHHAELIARSRGRDATRAHIGTSITQPNVDFALMAESMGVKGFGPVFSAEDLPAVLEEAVAIVVQERRPVLVDVLTIAKNEGQAVA